LEEEMVEEMGKGDRGVIAFSVAVVACNLKEERKKR